MYFISWTCIINPNDIIIILHNTTTFERPNFFFYICWIFKEKLQRMSFNFFLLLCNHIIYFLLHKSRKQTFTKYIALELVAGSRCALAQGEGKNNCPKRLSEMTGGLGLLNNFYPSKKWDLKILWLGIANIRNL